MMIQSVSYAVVCSKVAMTQVKVHLLSLSSSSHVMSCDDGIHARFSIWDSFSRASCVDKHRKHLPHTNESRLTIEKLVPAVLVLLLVSVLVP